MSPNEQTFEFVDSQSFFTETTEENVTSDAAVIETTSYTPSTQIHPLKSEFEQKDTLTSEVSPMVNKIKIEDNKIDTPPKSTFGQMKSYANILSTGISRVKNVFKQKSKEESSSDKEKEDVVLAVTKEKPEPVLTYTIPKIDEPDLHPEIPGLLFKQDMVRRNSKT